MEVPGEELLKHGMNEQLEKGKRHRGDVVGQTQAGDARQGGLQMPLQGPTLPSQHTPLLR